MRKNSFIQGALILTVAGIIVKFIGAFSRIYLSRLLGGEGIGLYQMAYPMLEAVQGHALVLVPHLEPQEARELAYWYGRQYPRVRRLPIQQKLYQALEKRGRQRE